MKKRLFPLILAGLLLLSGCQLANPDWETSKAEDQLAGFYVTPGYEHDWEGPTYFTQAPDGSYTLDGGDGWLFAGPDFSDPAFSDVSAEVHAGTNLQYESTLYVAAQAQLPVFCFNPVYRDSHGKLYAIRGSGMSFSGDNSVGMSSAYAMDTKSTTTVNGKTEEESVKFTVHLTLTAKPISYNLVFLDDRYQVLSSETHTPDQLPDAITPPEGTSCLLVETNCRDNMDRETVTRTIYTRDNQEAHFFIPDGSRVCTTVARPIKW